MRCDEIQEHLIDLIYDEGGDSLENIELREHLRDCPNCGREYEELQQTRNHLRTWKDESPLRSVRVPAEEFRTSRTKARAYLKYAAIAAVALICFLALTDAEIALNRNGFSYRSHLFAGKAGENYYTKSEVRDLLKRALDDSELRSNEASYIMARKILDMVERERWIETRLADTKAVRDNNN